MFSHVFLGLREFARACDRELGPFACSMAAAIALSASAQARAETLVIAGDVQFAPGATALAAPQRQALDELTRRRPPPWCVVLAVTRSGGPVTALNALEAARINYVARQFAMRGITVLQAGIGWVQPSQASAPHGPDTVTWGEERCPGTTPPMIDGSKPQP